MASISKAALATENSTSFPNNNTGYITPELLRNFNTDMIDSTVNQTVYTADSTSFDSRVDSLEAFSSSLVIDYVNTTDLNNATASLSSSLMSTINGKLDTSSFTSFSTSVDSRLDDLSTYKANLVGGNSFTGSQSVFGNITSTDNIIASANITASNGIKAASITASYIANPYQTNLGNVTASVAKVTNTLEINGTNFTFYSTSIGNLQNFSSSQYKSDSSSFDLRLDNLEYWSGTLDLQYATDAQLNASSSALIALIDTKLNTSSFNTFSSSYVNESASFDSRIIAIYTGSFAVTSSNTFVGTQTINGALQVSSSATYDVDITGGFQATAASRISGSSGINQITQTFSQVSASTGLSIMSRGYVAGQIGSNQIAIFSSGSSTIGSFTSAPIGIAGIAINSGSTANGWYYPIQFQPSTGYTDGRVTITTPISASIITGSSAVFSGSVNVSGAVNVNGNINVSSGSLNFTGSLNIASGYDFYANGNKQYNYASYYTTTTQSGSVLTTLTEESQVGFQNVSGSYIRAVNSGVYQVTANVALQNSATAGTSTISLKKNGNLISASTYGLYFTNAVSDASATSTAIVSMNANDYIEVGLNLVSTDVTTSGRISVIQIR